MRLSTDQLLAVRRWAYLLTWKGVRERLGVSAVDLRAIRSGADLTAAVHERVARLAAEEPPPRLCACGAPMPPTRYGTKRQARLCPTCRAASTAARAARQADAKRATRAQVRPGMRPAHLPPVCTHPGCTAPTATPRSWYCLDHGHNHGHGPPPVGSTPTAAADAAVCPRCGGRLGHDGPLVYCRRRHACGWLDLTRRALRSAPSPRGVP